MLALSQAMDKQLEEEEEEERQRQEEEEEKEEEEEYDDDSGDDEAHERKRSCGGRSRQQQGEEIPCDTLAAFYLLRQRMMQVSVGSCGTLGNIPMVITHLLYGVVTNRTTVDRELDELQRTGTLRMLKLPSRGEDSALVLSTDYAADISRLAAQETQGSKRSACTLLLSALPHARGASVAKDTLAKLVGNGVPDLEKAVTHLVSLGLLTPKRSQHDVKQAYARPSYWFSVPQMGVFVKSLVSGRKELLGFIKRARYKEILRSNLNLKQLRSTKLGIDFHVRDAVATGAVVICRVRHRKTGAMAARALGTSPPLPIEAPVPAAGEIVTVPDHNVRGLQDGLQRGPRRRGDLQGRADGHNRA